MSNLLEALRQETRDIHTALHENPILKACQENKLSLSEYVHMLTAFYEPWKKIIPSIEHVPIDDLKPLLVHRHQLLYSDLKALNVDEEILAPEETPVLNQDELLGACYVVIGSSMGATQLSQNVKTALGNQPISYLSMSPKEAGWPLLSGFIKSRDTSDFPETSSYAREVFELIQTELSDVGCVKE